MSISCHGGLIDFHINIKIVVKHILTHVFSNELIHQLIPTNSCYKHDKINCLSPLVYKYVKV